MDPRDGKVPANHQGSSSKVREVGLHLLPGGQRFISSVHELCGPGQAPNSLSLWCQVETVSSTPVARGSLAVAGGGGGEGVLRNPNAGLLESHITSTNQMR